MSISTEMMINSLLSNTMRSKLLLPKSWFIAATEMMPPASEAMK